MGTVDIVFLLVISTLMVGFAAYTKGWNDGAEDANRAWVRLHDQQSRQG